jgi:Na+-driven multidrug efflux pump
MLQNIGSAFRASLLSMARQGIFFIPAILILPKLFGILGLQIVQPVADVCAFLLTIPLVKPVLNKLKQNDAIEVIRRDFGIQKLEIKKNPD